MYQCIIYQSNRWDSAVNMTVEYNSDKSPDCTCSLLASDPQQLWVHQQYIHGVIFNFVDNNWWFFVFLLEYASD